MSGVEMTFDTLIQYFEGEEELFVLLLKTEGHLYFLLHIHIQSTINRSFSSVIHYILSKMTRLLGHEEFIIISIQPQKQHSIHANWKVGVWIWLTVLLWFIGPPVLTSWHRKGWSWPTTLLRRASALPAGRHFSLDDTQYDQASWRTTPTQKKSLPVHWQGI